MDTKLINYTKQTLIVPISSFLALVLLSYTFGWGFLSLLLFWFILIPILAATLPGIVSKNKFPLKQSILGLIIFYAFMVFMIYDHYQSDYFLIMMISLLSNIGVVAFFRWAKENIR